jgi:hypothetical protein
MYGLETLLQLAADGALQDAMKIEDSPDYSWRGLMVDSGRRFFPVPLLKDLMDTMAAVTLLKKAGLLPQELGRFRRAGPCRNRSRHPRYRTR